MPSSLGTYTGSSSSSSSSSSLQLVCHRNSNVFDCASSLALYLSLYIYYIIAYGKGMPSACPGSARSYICKIRISRVPRPSVHLFISRSHSSPFHQASHIVHLPPPSTSSLSSSSIFFFINNSYNLKS